MKRIVPILIWAVFLSALSLTFYLQGWWPFEQRAPTVVTVNSTPAVSAECPYTFVSWNIANFGRSRTREQIALMAKILRHADIIAVQEVTAGKNFGIQAVATLADELNRTGDTTWDYIVSNPTMPPSATVERYAFLFKRSSMGNINRDDAHLVRVLENTIEREPYAISLKPKDAEVLQIFTIHTVPTKKNPLHEVQMLTEAHEVRNQTRAIIAGDFNLGPNKTDRPMNDIGFIGHINQETSLKRAVRDGKYTLYQYDNIYAKRVNVCTAGVIDFVHDHFSPVTDDSLLRAREMSDHLPVFITFK